MKSRITKKFNRLREKDEKALIAYITSGDPNLDRTLNLVLQMEKAGADIIELGIPYSDPLADGPVIQRAAQRALKVGTNIDSIFPMVFKVREKTEIPLVFLVYFNSIYRYGIKRFLDKCKDSGVDGLIIPDLPLEERRELNEVMKDYPIDLIPLVAPTSEDRIRKIVSGAEGFVYCISSKGVTGTRDSFEVDLSNFINKVKKHTSIPLAIGFGISNEETIKKLKGLCDGLIVGSAIIEKVEEGIKDDSVEDKVFNFVSELHEAL
ncbi:tryptophan synthase subunit alpha [Anaeromicrobium sediminis]|uniref:Tryptophan synthase alpha chain n=1 Tax=Anaeromicrobium sediminis TaxID=1478221 RepID=A0A267MIY7_9FIRM|nr:tryptophan synthase subunit alpha [Anaeromicrobium sediminis]PAB59496.1 tryptophan synthase subunit alpha [Anaeromicrobium sediminis]